MLLPPLNNKMDLSLLGEIVSLKEIQVQFPEFLSSGVTEILSTDYDFAVLKNDGSVVTWGNSSYGGDSSSSFLNFFQVELPKSSRQIMLLPPLKMIDLSLLGEHSSNGGDSSLVSSDLSQVGLLKSSRQMDAFAALKE